VIPRMAIPPMMKPSPVESWRATMVTSFGPFICRGLLAISSDAACASS